MHNVLVQDEHFLRIFALRIISETHHNMKMAQALPNMIEKNIAYMSTSAFRRLSRDFSSVGCQIGMSKYLTRKGHTTLSRV